MAIRTSSSTARNTSYSKPSVPKKPSSASRSSSVSRTSTPTQSKPTSSAPRRDTFTRSTPTAKQTPTKTPTSKTSTASRSSQSKTSTTKTNNTVTVTKNKTTSSVSNTKRDSFEFSSEAVKNALRSTTTAKSSASSTSTAQKNAKNGQNKTTVKNDTSNKTVTSGSASKNKTDASKKATLESMQKAYEHTKDPKQRESMRKTMNDIAYGLSSKKTNKTTDILVKYDRSKIKSQFEYYEGDNACYATSADNMWRVNDGAVGNKIINLANDHKKDGILDNAPCKETTFVSDSGKKFTNNGQISVNEYSGEDENENKFTAVRIQGLSKDDYNELVIQELNKDKIVCVRVVNNVGDDPRDGHTMNIVGTNSQGEFLYENCGRYPTPLSTLKPATLADTGYTNSKGVKRQYFEVQEGQYEIWIDTTK